MRRSRAYHESDKRRKMLSIPPQARAQEQQRVAGKTMQTASRGATEGEGGTGWVGGRETPALITLRKASKVYKCGEFGVENEDRNGNRRKGKIDGQEHAESKSAAAAGQENTLGQNGSEAGSGDARSREGSVGSPTRRQSKIEDEDEDADSDSGNGDGGEHRYEGSTGGAGHSVGGRAQKQIVRVGGVGR